MDIRQRLWGWQNGTLIPGIDRREILGNLWRSYAALKSYNVQSEIQYSEGARGWVADGEYLGATPELVFDFLDQELTRHERYTNPNP